MYLEVDIHVGGVRNSAFREDQGEENPLFCCAGHLCASGLLCSPPSEVGLVPPWPLLGIKPPKHGKAGCSVWEGCQGTLLSLSSVMAWDLFSCQCLCLSSHAASLGRGNSHTEANDEHYSLSWFCWEGSAVQELWGSNWSTKNKELTCYGAWERNKKINGRREFRCVGECWWLKFQPAWEIVSLLVLLSQLEFLWGCCS